MSEQDEQGDSTRNDASGQNTHSTNRNDQPPHPGDQANGESESTPEGDGRTQEGMAGQGTGQIK